jgi:hypothetical protein
MYYSLNEIYEEELINILWSIGLKNLDIINKIIDINKKTKIDYNNKLTRKSRKFYIKIDSVGEYNPITITNNGYIPNIDYDSWENNRLWYNLHKELIIWHKYLYKNKKNIQNNI